MCWCILFCLIIILANSDWKMAVANKKQIMLIFYLQIWFSWFSGVDTMDTQEIARICPVLPNRILICLKFRLWIWFFFSGRVEVPGGFVNPHERVRSNCRAIIARGQIWFWFVCIWIWISCFSGGRLEVDMKPQDRVRIYRPLPASRLDFPLRWSGSTI